MKDMNLPPPAPVTMATLPANFNKSLTIVDVLYMTETQID